MSEQINNINSPSVLPASTGNGTAFSPDGNYMSVAHATTPFITIYKRDGDIFTKLDNPDVLPASTGNGIAFSPDVNYLSVAHNISPFITIYKRDGDVFTKLDNPDVLPPSTGRGTAFSPDGNYLSVAHATSPFITIYKRSGDVFTKLANPDVLPADTGNGTAFSPDGNYLSVAHVTTPFITIYRFITVKLYFLIKQDGKIITKTANVVVFTNITDPNQIDFEELGMNALNNFDIPISAVQHIMVESEVLGSGKIFRKTINRNQFKINSLEVK